VELNELKKENRISAVKCWVKDTRKKGKDNSRFRSGYQYYVKEIKG
jgi:hypothetical protein